MMLQGNMDKVMTLGLILTSVLTATPSVASEINWFGGLGVGYQADDVSGEFDTNGEDLTTQARGGVILDDTHRFMGTYSYMDKLKQHTVLGTYDYMIPVYHNVKLLVGAAVGASSSEIHSEDSTEFVWGGQVGAMYTINEHWSAEITYRYLEQDYEENNTSIEHSQQFVASVDYRF